jgi:AAA+ superfamily predicted ATPase
MKKHYADTYAQDRSEAIEQLHDLINKLAETDISLDELDALILDITDIITR